MLQAPYFLLFWGFPFFSFSFFLLIYFIYLFFLETVFLYGTDLAVLEFAL